MVSLSKILKYWRIRTMKLRLVAIIAMFTLAINITGCSIDSQAGLVGNKGTKYTLFIGLNDKDTYVQEISNEEAEEKIAEIALKYVDGFTQLSSKGAYKDEKGIITYENSLIFSFYYANDEQMESIMDEVLKELNQNSILIEKQKVNYEFYEGAKQ